MNTLSFLKEFLKKDEISHRWASPPNWASSLPFEQSLKTYFTPCSSVFLVNFEHVIAGWELDAFKKITDRNTNEIFVEMQLLSARVCAPNRYTGLQNGLDNVTLEKYAEFHGGSF